MVSPEWRAFYSAVRRQPQRVWTFQRGPRADNWVMELFRLTVAGALAIVLLAKISGTEPRTREQSPFAAEQESSK